MIKQDNKRGFTLVEMMVAIAVFSVVMVTAMSALINVIDANNKARSIKTAVNNVSFALESISRDMRMGTDYSCSSDGINFNESQCINDGVTEIRYKSSRADSSGRFAYYKFENNQIWECLEKGSNVCPNNDYQPITSSDVTIDSEKSRFYVLNVGDPTKQPRVIITISGEAGAKDKTKTIFDLQTGVSQRIRPE